MGRVCQMKHKSLHPVAEDTERYSQMSLGREFQIKIPTKAAVQSQSFILLHPLKSVLTTWPTKMESQLSNKINALLCIYKVLLLLLKFSVKGSQVTELRKISTWDAEDSVKSNFIKFSVCCYRRQNWACNLEDVRRNKLLFILNSEFILPDQEIPWCKLSSIDKKSQYMSCSIPYLFL